MHLYPLQQTYNQPKKQKNKKKTTISQELGSLRHFTLPKQAQQNKRVIILVDSKIIQSYH